MKAPFLFFSLSSILLLSSGPPDPSITPSAALISVHQIQKSQPAFDYQIDARLPMVPNTSAYRRLSAWLDAWQQEQFSHFETQAILWQQDAPQPPLAESALYLDYDVMAQTAELLSFRFHISPYFQGAAHPQHHYQSVNYHVPSQRILSLDDLFKKELDYLPQLAEQAKQALLAQERDWPLDMEWVNQGLMPRAENFTCFNLTPTALLLTFPPYQVAPYAAGAQTVQIPYTQLQTLLRPDSPLARTISDQDP